MGFGLGVGGSPPGEPPVKPIARPIPTAIAPHRLDRAWVRAPPEAPPPARAILRPRRPPPRNVANNALGKLSQHLCRHRHPRIVGGTHKSLRPARAARRTRPLLAGHGRCPPRRSRPWVDDPAPEELGQTTISEVGGEGAERIGGHLHPPLWALGAPRPARALPTSGPNSTVANPLHPRPAVV